MNKKIIAIVLAVLAAFGVGFGLNKTETKTETKTVTVTTNVVPNVCLIALQEGTKLLQTYITYSLDLLDVASALNYGNNTTANVLLDGLSNPDITAWSAANVACSAVS